jgi:hypothetical protein
MTVDEHELTVAASKNQCASFIVFLGERVRDLCVSVSSNRAGVGLESSSPF